MFSEEIVNFITHGQEEVNIEYKDSMSWKDGKVRLVIIRAMIALSNTQDGGVIVIGVQDKDSIPVGMEDGDFKSFNYDDICRFINNHCSPVIEFKLIADSLEIENELKKFIVIQVNESFEFPTICTKSEKYDNSKGLFPDNTPLRENAIYIRSKAPIESREIASVHEWENLIYRTIEKTKRRTLQRTSIISTEPDSRKFIKDLTNDSL